MSTVKKLLKYAALAAVVVIAVSATARAIKTHNAKRNALAAAKRAVVHLYDSNGGKCSATIVNQGYALTAHHCLPDNASGSIIINGIAVELPGPKLVLLDMGIYYDTQVAHEQPYTDSAILRGNYPFASELKVDLTEARVFKVDEAILCGFPGESLELYCVTAKRVSNRAFNALFDATVLPGMSGGGVFDSDGTLIGRVLAMTQDGQAVVGSTTGVATP